MAKGQFGGVYANMEFPEYVFREYPKAIKLKDGRVVAVNSQAEELRMIDEVVPVKDVAKIEQERDAVASALLEKEEQIKELMKKLEEATKPKTSVVNPPIPAPKEK